MRFSIYTTSLIFVLFMHVAGTASYAAIIYDESIHGDLPDDFVLAPIIDLPPAPKSNIFAIWITVGFIEVVNDPIDALRVRIPDNHRVVDVKIGSEVGDPNSSALRYRFFNIVDRSLAGAYEGPPSKTSLHDLLPIEGAPINPSTFFTPGIYDIELKADIDPPWEIEFTLELIPEPSTLAILAAAGSVLVRRNRALSQ